MVNVNRNRELSTREKIVQEFYKLMAKQGYKNTSLREVAEACGISKGNLSFHFKKKENIAIVIARCAYLRAYTEMQASVPEIDDAILMFLLHRFLLFYAGSHREVMFRFLAEMFENDLYMNWRAKTTYHDLCSAFAKQNVAFDKNELWEACVFSIFGLYGIINRLYVNKQEFEFERYCKLFLHTMFYQVHFEQGNKYIDEAFRIFSTLDIDTLFSELRLGDVMLLKSDDSSKIGCI